MVEKLKINTPIEYITKKVSFYSEEFFINYGALIPRPETEILIDEVLKIIKYFPSPNIAEIGIGSGIISIILSMSVPKAQIIATDISIKALEIAKINLKKFNIQSVELVKTPYLKGIYKDFDIIVSNPPYIANDFVVEKNLYHEPKTALFGGEIGDEILKNIIDLAIKKEVKYLICEMGYDQKDKIKNYLEDKSYESLSFYKDLSNFDRGFILKL